MKVFKFTLLFLISCCINDVFAGTSVLNSDFFGLESYDYGTGTVKNGWYIQKISGDSLFFPETDIVSSGNYSMKFNISETQYSSLSSNIKYLKVYCGSAAAAESSKVNVPAGKYTLTLDVYLTEKHPSAIQLWTDSGNGNGQKLYFKAPLSNLEINKWTSVTCIATKTGIDVITDSISNGKMTILFPKTTIPEEGATMFFDNIELFNETQTGMAVSAKVSKAKVYASKFSHCIYVENANIVKVFNALGQKIESFEAVSGLLTIPNLKNGIYFVETFSGEKKNVTKICL